MSRPLGRLGWLHEAHLLSIDATDLPTTDSGFVKVSSCFTHAATETATGQELVVLMYFFALLDVNLYNTYRPNASTQ